MMMQTRQAIGPDKLILANILRARFDEGGLEYLNYFDGSYLENFFHHVEGVSYEDYVAKGIDTMQKAARSGKIIAFTAGLALPKNTSQLGIDEAHALIKFEEQARAGLSYPLALFLICAEKHSDFRIHEGYSADKDDRWMRWHADFDKLLGPPQGPAKKEGHLYSRDFKHASVKPDIKNRTGKLLGTLSFELFRGCLLLFLLSPFSEIVLRFGSVEIRPFAVTMRLVTLSHWFVDLRICVKNLLSHLSPSRDHLFQTLRLLACEVVILSPIFRNIVEFPGLALKAHQLPIAIAQTTVFRK